MEFILFRSVLTKRKLSAAWLIHRVMHEKQAALLSVLVLAVATFLFFAPILSTNYPKDIPATCVYGCGLFWAHGSITYVLFGVGGVALVGGWQYFLVA